MCMCGHKAAQRSSPYQSLVTVRGVVTRCCRLWTVLCVETLFAVTVLCLTDSKAHLADGQEGCCSSAVLWEMSGFVPDLKIKWKKPMRFTRLKRKINYCALQLIQTCIVLIYFKLPLISIIILTRGVKNIAQHVITGSDRCQNSQSVRSVRLHADPCPSPTALMMTCESRNWIH